MALRNSSRCLRISTLFIFLALFLNAGAFVWVILSFMNPSSNGPQSEVGGHTTYSEQACFLCCYCNVVDIEWNQRTLAMITREISRLTWQTSFSRQTSRFTINCTDNKQWTTGSCKCRGIMGQSGWATNIGCSSSRSGMSSIAFGGWCGH